MSNKYDETETNSNNPGAFLVGAIFGGLVGAGAMLLLAPQSGERTRADIQLKGAQLREQATEAVEEGMNQTRRKARQIQSDLSATATEIKHSGQEMLDEQKARFSAAVSASKKAVLASQD